MRSGTRIVAWMAGVGLLQSCVNAPPPDSRNISAKVRRMVEQRQAAVVVSTRESPDHWMKRGFLSNGFSRDAEGGSATPISSDGYFLTADHVLRTSGENPGEQVPLPVNHVHLIYDHPDGLMMPQARVVWRSMADDIALLHAPISTPRYYTWVSGELWIPEGTSIVHGGLSTGGESSEQGRTSSHLTPEKPLIGHRFFKMDIPLKPGDSGGAVVNADGLLIGINSAVEFLVPMETAFFVDSEGCRPSLRKLQKIIQSDRLRNN